MRKALSTGFTVSAVIGWTLLGVILVLGFAGLLDDVVIKLTEVL